MQKTISENKSKYEKSDLYFRMKL